MNTDDCFDFMSREVGLDKSDERQVRYLKQAIVYANPTKWDNVLTRDLFITIARDYFHKKTNHK